MREGVVVPIVAFWCRIDFSCGNLLVRNIIRNNRIIDLSYVGSV